MLNNFSAAMLYIVFTEIGGNLFASSSFSFPSTTLAVCIYTPHIDASAAASTAEKKKFSPTV